MKSKNQRIAVGLAKIGISVESPSKTRLNPSAKAKVVGRLWRQRPHAPIAIVVGAKRGVIAVHVSGKEGRRSLKAITRAFGRVPRTLVVRAADDLIYLFSTGDKKQLERLELLQGVTVFGENTRVECVGGTEKHPHRFKKNSGPLETRLAAAPSWLIGSLNKGERLSIRPVKMVPIDRIRVAASRRKVRREQVEDLARAMEEIGLKTPVTVMKSGKDRFDLVAGLHRLEAAKRLGWKTIACHVLLGDQRDAAHWEISENFHRIEMTVLERSEAFAKWAAAFDNSDQVDQNYGKVGRPAGPNTKAARKIVVPGKSIDGKRHTIARARKIAAMSAEVKDKIRRASLDDNQHALLKIAKAPRNEQEAVIARLAGKGPGDIKRKPKAGGNALSDKSQAKFRKLRNTWSKATKLKQAWKKAKPDVRRKFATDVMGLTLSRGS